MSDIILDAQGLTKNFGGLTAVDNLNLKIKRGEFFGFLGVLLFSRNRLRVEKLED
jgi:ABC-type branched-subunit amino acid transport system ATPase component